MELNRRRLGLAAALALATPLAVMAQPAGNPGAGQAGPGFFKGSSHHGHHGGHFRRAGMGGPQGMNDGAMWRGLNLTEEQRDKLFELRHAQSPRMRELGKTIRNARVELRKLALSDGFDEAKAKELAATASQAGAEMAVLRARLQHETYALLTPEQRTQFARRGERRQGGMRWNDQRGPRGAAPGTQG